MANKQIRLGQLIAPFGPGSLYTDSRGTPHLVCGLDFWHKRWTRNGVANCEKIEDFIRFEPRLSELLKVNSFRIPPDFRRLAQGNTPPPNHSLNIPAHRFPTWYRHSRTHKLRKFNLGTDNSIIRGMQERDPNGQVVRGVWQPVRFVAVCSAGHLCEFPWKRWCGCTCQNGDESLHLLDQGGSDLASIQIKCNTCNHSRSLSGTTIRPQNPNEKSAFQTAGITCPGERPWLGDGAAEAACALPLVACLINQTSIYFPRTTSAISIPFLQPQSDIFVKLRNDAQRLATIGAAKAVWRMAAEDAAVAMIRAELARTAGVQQLPPEATDELLKEVLKSLFDEARVAQAAGSATPAAAEPELLGFRRAEFNIIRNGINDPARAPDLRVVPSGISPDLAPWFDKVNLVERLKETRVFFGFDRLEQTSQQLAQTLAQMPDPVLRQLFRNPPAEDAAKWLPAVEVFGEGIYFELKEKKIKDWQDENESWLKARLDDQFLVRLGGIFQILPPTGGANREWASRYLLVHSLAHILINQLVFECGYSTASLRERLYISADTAAPMAAFMIYTAAGDSEGTLGGLVRLGRPERLGPVVLNALSRASWCSADPVCSEHLGGQGSKLANLAACHGCVLLPETSCETINHGLDRAMVVGTPEARKRGFMSALLDQAPVPDQA